MPAKRRTTTVRVDYRDEVPEDVTPVVHVFDTYGRRVDSGVVDQGLAEVTIPGELEGAALRFVIAPEGGDVPEEPDLADLRRLGAKEVLRTFDPDEDIVIEVEPSISAAWRLCFCEVRGRVVKPVEQPDGTTVDRPVCDARVEICEVDALPRIIWRIPDDLIWRLREELVRDVLPGDLREPLPQPPEPLPRMPKGPVPPDRPGPVTGRRPDVPRRSGRPRRVQVEAAGEITGIAAGGQARRTSVASVGELASRLRLAPSTSAVRRALLDVAPLWPWWCWFRWLDPWFTYRVDCPWTVTTDGNGEFSLVIVHSCADTPDLHFHVEQEIGGSWRTIYDRGVRCDTHWDYDCDSEVTLRVDDPDARVCIPPPEIELPDGTTTWVLPMGVGHMEIAGTAGTVPAADPLAWLHPDGEVSYAGGPANVAPIADAPLGGTLRFRMLHSLDLPKTGMMKYRWTYRPKPAPGETPAPWQPMTMSVGRHYRYQPPGDPTPHFPVHPLGPSGPDMLYDFRPHSPPYPHSVWPTHGFASDQWSAGEHTGPWTQGRYQIRVTVHEDDGTLVRPNQASPGPSSPTFDFLVTDGRSGQETFSTRLADPSEIIDDGFVFEAVVDNASCTGAVDPVATSDGTEADDCGFLRYTDKASTQVIITFEASHPRNQAWFALDVVRGQDTIDQVSVNRGGQVGATSVPTDPTPPPPAGWPPAHYTGDGAGNFTGTFPLNRLLEHCDNAAFSIRLRVRAKAHNGQHRLHALDDTDTDAFALAEED